MTPQEKSFYHQIHPLKLLTDSSTGLLALYFFWRHDFVAAVATALIPAMVVSSLLINFANLERQRASRLGHYVQRYMTRTMEALRLVGYVIMAAGAWYHALFFVGLGLLIILSMAQRNSFRSIFKMILGCKGEQYLSELFLSEHALGRESLSTPLAADQSRFGGPIMKDKLFFFGIYGVQTKELGFQRSVRKHKREATSPTK